MVIEDSDPVGKDLSSNPTEYSCPEESAAADLVAVNHGDQRVAGQSPVSALIENWAISSELWTTRY